MDTIINSTFNKVLPSLPTCKCLSRCAALFTLSILIFHSAQAQMSILQHGYDTNVSGANLTETILTPSNVSPSTFGRIFSLPVDGTIYAQPLYVPNLTINGSTHNVVFVATMKNIVYAFDADTVGAPLWQVNYSSTAVSGSSPVPITDFVGSNSYNIAGPVGIESTPVINAGTNTMYFVTNTLESGNIVFRLHAVDITTGNEKFGGPVVITGSYTLNGNTITFNPGAENQRTSLTIANGQIIIGFASHEDDSVWYGWVMSYNASTLAQSAVLNTVPSNYGGGVWQSGRPPAVDSSGYVYLFTGNGMELNSLITADGVNNFAESVLKLDPKTLKVIDYFTPSNYQYLDVNDFDFTSSGPSLIPGTNVLVGGGKIGTLYALNTQNLGHMQTNDAGALQAIVGASNGEIRGGPTIWNRPAAAGGPLVFNWGAWDTLKVYSFNSTTNNLTQTSATTDGTVYPGAMLTLSANGNNNGIVWTSLNSQGDADHRQPPGEIRAYDPTNLSQALWTSTAIPARDDLGLWMKWVPPVVVNGKVYVATQSNQLMVYGLLPTSGAPLVTAWPPRKDALGAQANYFVSALSASGSSLTATWSVSGLPTGATGQFLTDSHGRTNLEVLLNVNGTTPSGLYPLNLTANVAGNQTTQSVLLNIPGSTAFTPLTAVADSQVSPHISEAAIDANINTFWKTLDSSTPTTYPHSVSLDLGSTQLISGISYLPRQDGCVDGTALQYEVYLSTDNVNWFTQPAGGSFDYGPAWRSYACDSQTFPQIQKIAFPATSARYVLLNVLGAVEGGTPWASAAELRAYVANTSEPQVVLSSSASNITVGQSVTFTATVSGNSPTGTVQFYNNGIAFQSPVALSSGSASLTTTNLNTAGTDVIAASYSGDTNNAAITALTPLTETVTFNPVNVTLASSAATVTVGQSVTFTATVTGNTPTGTVQFYINSVAVQSPVTISNGSAALTTNTLNTTGTDLITASYSGDVNNATYTTSTALAETVTLAQASVTLSSSAGTISSGSPITYTATVSGNTPTGTVQFYLNGVAIGSPITLTGGAAILTTTAPAASGTDLVTASYSGDTRNAGTTSSAPLTENVTPSPVNVPALPWFYQVLLAIMLFSAGTLLTRRKIN